MPSAAQIYGSAILNALGTGIDTAGSEYSKLSDEDKKAAQEQQKLRLEYYLKGQQKDDTSSMVKDINWALPNAANMSPQDKLQLLYNLRSATGGTTVQAGDVGLGGVPDTSESASDTSGDVHIRPLIKKPPPSQRAPTSAETYRPAAQRVSAALKAGKAPDPADWGIVKAFEKGY